MVFYVWYTETWNRNLKLKPETEIWNRNLNPNPETETCNRNLKPKPVTETWNRNLKPKLVTETCNRNLKPKPKTETKTPNRKHKLCNTIQNTTRIWNRNIPNQKPKPQSTSKQLIIKYVSYGKYVLIFVRIRSDYHFNFPLAISRSVCDDN